MRKVLFATVVIALFSIVFSCKKTTSTTNNARTVQGLSGSYSVTGLDASFAGLDSNLYNALPACEKDNIIKLNTDKSVQFIDAGTKCVPPTDSTGTWSISQNTDTIYVASQSFFIKTWDGTTLVLTDATSISGFPVTITTTLAKQ